MAAPPNITNYPEELRFLPVESKSATQDEVVAALKNSGAEILLNYILVGSKKAACFYAKFYRNYFFV
ncbi:Inositol-1-phosphate synthase [Methanosarcina barkeri str. Wiesmoor]|uniref:Inositol-1-phosphate synthase n=1 Tax=Methanosarcina barkeri str. Wiesmoor TaxID=1434109 RepID=A0A0E3QM28_METBA|nr:hypothetical protein [Methanosarcina barkeri]AKB51350.1 Inositol-1-phosphate synthase [Methanosarcina barkeri str. Wiesmoor]